MSFASLTWAVSHLVVVELGGGAVAMLAAALVNLIAAWRANARMEAAKACHTDQLAWQRLEHGRSLPLKT